MAQSALAARSVDLSGLTEATTIGVLRPSAAPIDVSQQALNATLAQPVATQLPPVSSLPSVPVPVQHFFFGDAIGKANDDYGEPVRQEESCDLGLLVPRGTRRPRQRPIPGAKLKPKSLEKRSLIQGTSDITATGIVKPTQIAVESDDDEAAPDDVIDQRLAPTRRSHAAKKRRQWKADSIDAAGSIEIAVPEVVNTYAAYDDEMSAAIDDPTILALDELRAKRNLTNKSRKSARKWHGHLPWELEQSLGKFNAWIYGWQRWAAVVDVAA